MTLQAVFDVGCPAFGPDIGILTEKTASCFC